MDKFFLDDELVLGDAVSAPLMSRGYAFGYGVFETMAFRGGVPCFFSEHFERLQRAARGAGLKVELDEAVVRRRACRLFEEVGVRDGVFKIVISDSGETPRVALFVRTVGLSGEPRSVRLRGSQVVKASQAFTSRHKTLNYMESVRELEKAKAAGFDECVFSNEFGNVTECAVANLFFVSGGVLKTPALDCGLLDGIVRSKVIGLARSMGIGCEEGCYSEQELLRASEAFLTSSGNGPGPVASFEARSGESVVYGTDLLSKLREAFVQLESEEARFAGNE